MIFVSTFTKFFLEKKKYVYIFNKRDCLNNFKAEQKRKNPWLPSQKLWQLQSAKANFNGCDHD